jgi:hypothetical protein
MNISVPRTIKECRPDQLVKWLHIAPFIQERKDDLNNLLDFQVQLISIFSDLPMNKVRKGHIDDVLKISAHLITMLSEFRSAEPTGRIEIDGKVYVFQKDFALISTGQIVDLKLIENVHESPHEALAILYIEEGMEYCQEDDRGRVLNPNAKRAELFKSSFPGDEFLNVFGFFLHSSRQRKLAMLGIQMMRMEIQKRKIEKSLSQTVSGSAGQRSSSTWLKNLISKWKIS